MKKEVVSFTPASNRIYLIRLKSKYRKLSIVNVHCPTEEKDTEDKEAFYKEIERWYNTIPNYDVEVVIRDYNAKIGKEEKYKPTIGSHSKHTKLNENGRKLNEFALEKELRAAKTYFKKIHKGTWISPDKKTVNQIDHILIEGKHLRYITDA